MMFVFCSYPEVNKLLVVVDALFDEYLEGYLKLGGSLRVPGGLIGGSLDLHRHGEDWCMHWA